MLHLPKRRRFLGSRAPAGRSWSAWPNSLFHEPVAAEARPGAMAHGPSLEGRASAARQKSVFLNLPYDARFRSLFLAYVAGTSAFGLIPRATLEIPGSARRLDRILALMESCQYSIHDMSRVQLDRRPPPAHASTCPLSWVSRLGTTPVVRTENILGLSSRRGHDGCRNR